MFYVNININQIAENEYSICFVQSTGPEGQNVNKVASAAQLRFDVKNSLSLSEPVKQRLMRLAGSRMTVDGVLVLEARRYRERERNRQDAINRLHRLVEQAQQIPLKRVPTRPHPAAVKERLDAKKRRSAIKHVRQFKPELDD